MYVSEICSKLIQQVDTSLKVMKKWLFKHIFIIRRNIFSVFHTLYIDTRRYIRRDDAIMIRLSGGLCNRLCTLISTKIACEYKNKEIQIIWKKNNSCWCEFRDLFSSDIDIISDNDFFDFDDWNRFDNYLTAKHKTMFYVDNVFRPFEKVLTDPDRAQFMLGVPENYIKKFHQELNNLNINTVILQKMMHIPEETIGVHIRKSDFLNKRNQLDYWWFEHKMNEEIYKNKNVVFFLATDCSETKRKIIDLFWDRVLSYSFCLSVNQKNFLQQRWIKEWMQDALLDLLTLSKTKKIIGSYGSSFSWLAAMWWNIPLEHHSY